jgi:hypothetical protein
MKKKTASTKKPEPPQPKKQQGELNDAALETVSGGTVSRKSTTVQDSHDMYANIKP